MESSWKKCENIIFLEVAVRHSIVLLKGRWKSVLKNIQELMEGLKLEHTSEQWRFSLIHLRSLWRQCYSTIEIVFLLFHWIMQIIWKKIKRNLDFAAKKPYVKQWWNILVYVDLKLTAMLTVLQSGYTKLFLMWNVQPSEGLTLHNKKKKVHSVQRQHQVRRMWHTLL